MDAGLRFLDLRVRVLADGQLYMYHGGIVRIFQSSSAKKEFCVWAFIIAKPLIKLRTLLSHTSYKHMNLTSFLAHRPPLLSQIRLRDERSF